MDKLIQVDNDQVKSEMYEMLSRLIGTEGVINNPDNRRAIKSLLAKARDEKTKTVIDAVNKFKGVWKFSDHFSASYSYGNWTVHSDYTGSVCTVEGFNNLVSELSAAEWIK